MLEHLIVKLQLKFEGNELEIGSATKADAENRRTSTPAMAMKRKPGRPPRGEPPHFNEFDLSLIQQFKRHPIFYDCQHPKYRNRECTNRAWSHIADDLNMPVNQVKTRINQLRNRYHFEKKRLESLQQSDYTATPKWTLYKHLNFLSDYVKVEVPYNFRPKTAPIMSIADEHAIFNQHSLMRGSCCHLQSTSFSNTPTTIKDHVEERCKAFGQFLALCLMEMNEIQSLQFIEKFTIDLVKGLRRTSETESEEQNVDIDIEVTDKSESSQSGSRSLYHS
uniref:MADF domain-containing protein n=1 Tax=Glossina austeni TaxID=7395 RepID=A0A1A9VUZ9_GLOAU